MRKILRRVLSWNFQNLTREEVLALLPNISPSIFCRLFLILLESKSCVVVMLVFSVLSIQIDNVWLADSRSGRLLASFPYGLTEASSVSGKQVPITAITRMDSNIKF